MIFLLVDQIQTKYPKKSLGGGGVESWEAVHVKRILELHLVIYPIRVCMYVYISYMHHHPINITLLGSPILQVNRDKS